MITMKHILGLLLLVVAVNSLCAPYGGLIKYNQGDLMIGSSGGHIYRYSRTGILLEDIFSEHLLSDISGTIFDKFGNLVVVGLNLDRLSRFNSFGLLSSSEFGFCDPGSLCQSIVMDMYGNYFVGQGAGTKVLLKFSSTGARLDSYVLEYGIGGVNWIELFSDQCTMFYTSLDNTIRKYDICNRVQLPYFAIAPSGPCYGMKVYNDGGLLVACTDKVYRYDYTGQLLTTFIIADCYPHCDLRTLNLDQDWFSFWVGDYKTGKLYHVNAETGAVIFGIETGLVSKIYSSTIYGEQTVARELLILTPQIGLVGINKQFILTIRLINHLNPQNITVTIFRVGINGDESIEIPLDNNGYGTFSYTGFNIGDDYIFGITNEHLFSNLVSLKWIDNGGSGSGCQYGEMLCMNSTFYQTCVTDQFGNTVWSQPQNCCSGFNCHPDGNMISCSPLPFNTTTCTYSHMRCVSQTEYQICNVGLDGTTFWSQKQVCGTGYECHPVGEYIYCY